MLLAVLTLCACETVAYYSQAATGQLSLLWARESIDEMLQSAEVDQDIKRKLALVLEARDFAEQQLGMSAGHTYTQYVELDRAYVVWNVFAAPEFSTAPINWCYPIAGCVAYQGYFSETAAQEFGQKLRSEGYDVYIGGVDAYSTLGWFDDPLTSSVLRRPDHRVVALIFHELAHQKIYVPGDTTFNESFASFVEEEGLRRWFEHYPHRAYEVDLPLEQSLQDDFVALVGLYRERFAALYEQPLDESLMRQEKVKLQQQLREAYEELSERWGRGAYDRWFAGPLNNAQLGTIASYNDYIPAFAVMLQQEAGDLERFFARVKALSQLSRDQREASLEQLMSKGLDGSQLF